RGDDLDVELLEASPVGVDLSLRRGFHTRDRGDFRMRALARGLAPPAGLRGSASGEDERCEGESEDPDCRFHAFSCSQRATVTKKRTVAAMPSRSDAAQTGRLFVNAATAPSAIATWKRATVFAKPWWWWRSSSASLDFSSRPFSFSLAFASISFCCSR